MLLCNEKLIRKVILFKKMGMFGQGGDIRVRRAVSLEDLAAAYQLVHDAFVEKGYISPRPGGIRVRKFETLPEMATFIAEVGRRVVAVMSIVPDSVEFGLPSNEAFSEELDSLRRMGRSVCEITNLAVANEFRRSNAFPELTRACYAQALAWDCDDIFIAISPGHSAFFEEILRFDHFGDSRSYSAEKMDIVEGKRMDLRTIEDRWHQADQELGEAAFICDYYCQHNRYHEYVRVWTAIARRAFMDPTLLRPLFVERTGFLTRCSSGDQEAIRGRWGDSLFEEVLNSETAELMLV